MKLLICIAIIFMFSCSNPKEKYINNVCIELNKLSSQIINNYSYIIIIPGSGCSGCSGCITEAEKFYMDNKENKNIFFIYTDILSIKSIKLKVGKDVTEKANVYFDINNIFLSNDYNENIYPLIFNIKNKKTLTIIS